MPVLNVDQAHSVIMLKRSVNPGFAGIDNPLFYADHTVDTAFDPVTCVAARPPALNAYPARRLPHATDEWDPRHCFTQPVAARIAEFEPAAAIGSSCWSAPRHVAAASSPRASPSTSRTLDPCRNF